jgi:phosphopantetheinyl transferase
MPLFYQDSPTEDIRLAIWHIQEEEDFFLSKVPLSKEIQHPHKRKQHLAGRYLLSFLAPDFPLSEIAIAGSRKPYLKDDLYHFSISHCGDYAAAIVSKSQRVGIDIEVFDAKVLRIQHKFLNKAELDFTREYYPGDIQLFTTLWCAKEAVYKWFSFGKVNFKENIRLAAFSLKNEGSFKARFLNLQLEADLQVRYQLFQDISMTWVSEE